MKKDRKVIESPSEKGQGNIVNPGQKTGSIFFICILTSPGQEDRAYDQRNQSFKTGNNTSI